jgi:hypothetical protein
VATCIKECSLWEVKRYAVKYIRANGYQNEKENHGILGVQIWAISLSRQKSCGQGTKLLSQFYSPSHRCVLINYYLNSCFGRGSGVVIWKVIHSEEGLLLGIVLIPCHKDVIDHFCSFFILRWL